MLQKESRPQHDAFIQLNDANEGMIKNGRLYEYVKGEKDKEESFKGKSPSNTTNVGTNRKRKKTNKGKRL